MKNIISNNSIFPDTSVGAGKCGLKGLLSTNFSLFQHAKAWAQKPQSSNFSLCSRLKPGLKDNFESRIYGGKKKGFGLLEVLISAVIIIMILAALVFIGRAALNNNEYLSQRAQAIYLAQEGLEMTRQIRDTNWIDGDNTTKWDTLAWNSTAFMIPISSADYAVQYSDPPKRMYLTNSSSYDVNINGVTFTRKIGVKSVASPLIPQKSGTTDLTPYAKKVTATVTWTFSGQSKSINVSEILTNWRPDF